ncbi:conserved hypothetical protein [Solidesulfovibrio fructosivorans JJ]]|uniref:Uncharacterized protein n=1 Tax=Solidesulfovibrio fructosivorans JJ] TaxID=596151 RepID=E1K042_SOLFR|nr:hypothetical protein [Solidesulfovibrio fructosivorans]EFL50048.1 conserved hypothetical protein [Solidesulfovibrio fructosivorans JJ]]
MPDASTVSAVSRDSAHPGPEETRCVEIDLSRVDRDVTEEDEAAFARINDTRLSPEQVDRIVNPARTYPRQEYVLAAHWHPEHVPMELLKKRIDNLYPGRVDELVIPTQHNVLLEYDGYQGVEVDCYSSGFNRKVQLLLHFKGLDSERAEVLSSMLRHTHRYRASQLFEYVDALAEPVGEQRRQIAAGRTNSDEEMVEFVRIQAAKIKALLLIHEGDMPEDAYKNKLVRNFLDTLRSRFGDRIVNRAQVYAKAVKDLVKEAFSLSYFYRASEIIEEARSLGAGIVIPHPEQFWPILLADYDVDGIEVWNPQSQQYTEFLINVVNRRNRMGWHGKRPLLIFMGDDCHMSEKTRPPAEQDTEKAAREIGLQPAWHDFAIRKSLIINGVSRRKIINEYRSRLGQP